MRIDDDPKADPVEQLTGAKEILRVSAAFEAAGELGMAVARRDDEKQRHDESPGDAHGPRQELGETRIPNGPPAQVRHVFLLAPAEKGCGCPPMFIVLHLRP
jgi:hypothetical protein